MIKKTYSYEFKKQMVELYFEGYSAQELATTYDISSRGRVHEWVRLVRDAGTTDVLKDKRGISNKGKKKVESFSLKEENERLKLENMYLKKLLALKRR